MFLGSHIRISLCDLYKFDAFMVAPTTKLDKSLNCVSTIYLRLLEIPINHKVIWLTMKSRLLLMLIKNKRRFKMGTTLSCVILLCGGYILYVIIDSFDICDLTTLFNEDG